ncbi:cytochrome oxidase subunit III [Gossypium australe]|uniref:Cytochrome c oxidase subunit 3 n=1 Tax=Gossypium australe TaxID=47621 RepID=A0A5B6X0T4_9ROSI|nr:cytochrome oxidase subunit III [Gossypium australe]
MEYYQAPFTISNSTLFLIICGIRQYLGHLTKEHHVGFEAATWYWHFVDGSKRLWQIMFTKK